MTKEEDRIQELRDKLKGPLVSASTLWDQLYSSLCVGMLQTLPVTPDTNIEQLNQSIKLMSGFAALTASVLVETRREYLEKLEKGDDTSGS